MIYDLSANQTSTPHTDPSKILSESVGTCKAEHHRGVFRHLTAVLDGYVYISGTEQSLVDLLLVWSMGEDLTAFHTKILVELRKLNQYPLVSVFFLDVSKPHRFLRVR